MSISKASRTSGSKNTFAIGIILLLVAGSMPLGWAQGPAGEPCASVGSAYRAGAAVLSILPVPRLRPDDPCVAVATVALLGVGQASLQVLPPYTVEFVGGGTMGAGCPGGVGAIMVATGEAFAIAAGGAGFGFVGLGDSPTYGRIVPCPNISASMAESPDEPPTAMLGPAQMTLTVHAACPGLEVTAAENGGESMHFSAAGNVFDICLTQHGPVPGPCTIDPTLPIVCTPLPPCPDGQDGPGQPACVPHFYACYEPDIGVQGVYCADPDHLCPGSQIGLEGVYCTDPPQPCPGSQVGVQGVHCTDLPQPCAASQVGVEGVICAPTPDPFAVVASALHDAGTLSEWATHEGETAAGAVVEVNLSQCAYEPGESILARLALVNRGLDPLFFTSLDWTSTIYSVQNLTQDVVQHAISTIDTSNFRVNSDNESLDGIAVREPEPAAIGGFSGSTLFTKDQAVPAGSRFDFFADVPESGWNGELPNGSLAPAGIYLYVAKVPTLGWDRFMGVASFAIGANATCPPTPTGLVLNAQGTDPGSTSTSARGYNFTDHRKWVSPSIVWKYNNAGKPDFLVQADVIAAATAGFTTWNDDPASYTDFSYGGTTTGGQRDMKDGINVVGWAATMSKPNTLAEAYCKGPEILTECYMVFNSAENWSAAAAGPSPLEYDFQAVATHEAGHWLRLQHTPGSADTNNVMYNFTDIGAMKRALTWGDKSGVRYVYPNTYDGPASIGTQTQGIDAVAANIDGGSAKDVIVAWVDNPPTYNSIKYRVGWNVASGTGSFGSWSATETAIAAPNVGMNTAGLGIAVANLDTNARPDLLVAWVDDPSGTNTIYYRIGWNMDTSGVITSWTTTKQIATGEMVGASTQGLGVCLTSLSGNDVVDVVVAWVDNPTGNNAIRYMVGQGVTSLGDVPVWGPSSATFHVAKPGAQIGTETSGMGLTCTDLDGNGQPDLAMALVDNPKGANHVHYLVGFNPSPAGDVANADWVGTREAPGGKPEWIGDETQGLGIASMELDNAAGGSSELAFFWVDHASGGNNVYYRTEWNARVNSHI